MGMPPGRPNRRADLQAIRQIALQGRSQSPFVAPPAFAWSGSTASPASASSALPDERGSQVSVIWEAFQPETEPRRSFRREDRESSG
jgi:penicillin-binding protein 1A